MNKIAYKATKAEFRKDVILNQFSDKVRAGVVSNHMGGGSFSEIASWESNGPKIKDLLDLSEIPDDVIVSFEFQIPRRNNRIDCVLYGIGEDDNENVIHIELKQWNNKSVTELYDTGVFRVTAFVGGAYRTIPHPSQQVAGYQMHLMNYMDVFSETSTHLDGVAYCFNYRKNIRPNALYAPHYQTILNQHRLYSGDEISELSEMLRIMLGKGQGLRIFNNVANSEIRASKSLLNCAANMLRGVTEFALQDDQITASKTIYAKIEEAKKKSGKTVIIVKGGPGTGKTLIALDMLAQLAQNEDHPNMYYTTRSKALRESLKRQLSEVKLPDGNNGDASDLIINIFQLKPYNFSESQIDLLMVDEAHRVQKSSNYMGDKKHTQTYLSQTMSLIYCSKVTVFFIDDKQGIKTDEIGYSCDIIETAKKYRELINDFYGSDFYKDIKNSERKLEKKKVEMEKLIHVTPIDEKRIAKLSTDIDNYESDMIKKDAVNHVNSTLDTDIDIVELDLQSQFRCNGSDNYLRWLDKMLYLPSDKIIERFDSSEYEFGIFKSPHELYDKIVSLNVPDANPPQVSRICAGYCWDWSVKLEKNGDLAKDVKIGDFEMPWETNNVQARGIFRDMYASSADTWAIEPAGINQVGCIFSMQGFELDYVGVILGPDIKYDSENDCLVGVTGKNHAVKNNDPKVYTRLIRNSYRVLMSRGKKGCFIYCVNPDVAEFIEKCLAVNDIYRIKEMVVEDYVDEEDKFVKYLPLYSMKAACGYFGDGEDVYEKGWIDAGKYGRLDRNMFVVRALGNSMEPKIHDGDYCIFRSGVTGSRNGKTLLVQHHDYVDGETGGAYSIKQYSSEKSIDRETGEWKNEKITLHPLNNDYDDIVIESFDVDRDNEYRVVGEFMGIIS